MTLPDYEYKGLMARAWDALRGDTSQWSDRLFYREAIGLYGQPVLDVGCGTGRLLLDYLHQNIDVDGVDNSPEMLALCRQKAEERGLRPRLYEQYMETLSLQLITDAAMADRAMRRLCAHLEAGGALVAPFMTLWREGEPLESEGERTAALPEDGATVRRVARSRYDPATECEHTEDLYQVIVAGEVVAEEKHQRSPATRSYTQAQARALFERAGFAEIALFSGFTFAPAAPEDPLFTVVGRRATDR